MVSVYSSFEVKHLSLKFRILERTLQEWKGYVQCEAVMQLSLWVLTLKLCSVTVKHMSLTGCSCKKFNSTTNDILPKSLATHQMN